MSKDKISDYSATANSNTDIGGINIDEGCAPSGINDAIRTLMKQLKDWQSGSQDVYIHPAGSASVPSITANGDTNTGLFFPAADTVGITTGGTERARVDSSGNLGLGVTPSGTWKLDIAGYVKSAASAGGLYDAVYTGTTAGSTLGQLRFNGSGSGVTAESKIVGALNSGSITSSYLGFYTTNAGSQSQAMTLDASGNLGVGTTSPAQKLDVSGQALVTNLYLRSDDSDVSWGAGSGSRPLIRGNTTNNTLQFYTASAERARIDSSGNLLVGTTSVVNSGFVSVLCNATQKTPISIKSSVDASSAYYIRFVNNSGTDIGAIQVNSSNNGINYLTSSDYRLKENIQPMTGALAKVAALKPCIYTWKDCGASGQGFIAHELQEVVPECVSGEKDAIETYIDDEGNEQTKPKYQGIDTSHLVATLTAAIQEQQAIIETLTNRITALEQA